MTSGSNNFYFILYSYPYNYKLTNQKSINNFKHCRSSAIVRILREVKV